MKNDDLLIHIDDLGLPRGTRNALIDNRIISLGDLVSKSDINLLRLRNFGETSLRWVRRKLRERGLSLGMKPPKAPRPTFFDDGDDMSLRDYFAAAALTGMTSSAEFLKGAKEVATERCISVEKGLASSAYDIADAMIRERDNAREE
jgi:hypothetical protein